MRIEFSPEQIARLKALADQEGLTIEQILDTALEEYLDRRPLVRDREIEPAEESALPEPYRQAFQKIQAEEETFQGIRADLLQRFAGEYVAIHNGKVIDHDDDLRELYLRVDRLLGETPALIRQVTPEEEQVLHFRSPYLQGPTTRKESTSARAEGLVRVAQALAQAGGVSQARKVLARTRILYSLASLLLQEEHTQALQEALVAAREIAEVLREGLKAAQGIKSPDARSEALVALAPHLPEDLLWEVLETARKIKRPDIRAETLAGLAPYLSEDLLQEALKTARRIRWSDARDRALAGLTPYLPEGRSP